MCVGIVWFLFFLCILLFILLYAATTVLDEQRGRIETLRKALDKCVEDNMVAQPPTDE